jgi:hypothetical protein
MHDIDRCFGCEAIVGRARSKRVRDVIAKDAAGFGGDDLDGQILREFRRDPARMCRDRYAVPAFGEFAQKTPRDETVTVRVVIGERVRPVENENP